ncbi:type II toxin-antitoxin system HicA family toxin [Colibacter massiliensis]|uniref:type II toxin-antitoxin system HicA family toxin n=1 Tax=Colibacter massiliensis TaxID=1852379 RepID=UPI00094E4547|nr:type II toxin-antitoxin system HicA family toxin [Colibacter massiliensis]
MKISEPAKLLRKNGCLKLRSGSRHDIWYSPITGNELQIPRHNAKEVKTGTVQAILKDAGLK